MTTGTVKWFSLEKGYGFVESEAVDGDLFVHFTSVQVGSLHRLEEGSAVSFEIAPGERGEQAVNVAAL